MSTYVIAYDLNIERPNYAVTLKAIATDIEKLFFIRWRPITTSWIVESDMTTHQIAASVVDNFNDNDRLFVFLIGKGTAWSGKFSDNEETWLTNRFK